MRLRAPRSDPLGIRVCLSDVWVRVDIFDFYEYIWHRPVSESRRSRCRGLCGQTPTSGPDDATPLSPRVTVVTRGTVTLSQRGVS